MGGTGLEKENMTMKIVLAVDQSRNARPQAAPLSHRRTDPSGQADGSEGTCAGTLPLVCSGSTGIVTRR